MSARERCRLYTVPKIGKIYGMGRNETRYIYKEIFEDREYIQHGVELGPGNVVFDVGANIGLFSLFTMQECNRDVTIFAFEPIPTTYECLRKNVALHGLDNADRVKIEVLNTGLTALGGPSKAEFFYYRNAAGNTTMKLEEKKGEIQRIRQEPDGMIDALKQGNRLLYYALKLFPFRSWLMGKMLSWLMRGEQVVCPLTSLSAVCRQYNVERIDLLKVDVEGAELDVLEGIEDGHWPQIRQVVMEAHDVNNRVGRIKQLLGSKGFGKIVVARPAFAQSSTLNNHNIYATR